MMNEQKLEDILGICREFAASNSEIVGLALGGSWARGTATTNSDVDLLFIADDQNHFRSKSWISDLPFHQIGEEFDEFRDQTYGVVWSRHIVLKSGTKIEFSFADISWCNTNPIDEGTKKVVLDGIRILYDPENLLASLLAGR